MQFHLLIIEGRELPTSSKPLRFVITQMGSINQSQSKYQTNQKWNEAFTLEVSTVVQKVTLILESESEQISRAQFLPKSYEIGKVYSQWIELESLRDILSGGYVRIQIQVTAKGKTPFVEYTIKELSKKSALPSLYSNRSTAVPQTSIYDAKPLIGCLLDSPPPDRAPTVSNATSMGNNPSKILQAQPHPDQFTNSRQNQERNPFLKTSTNAPQQKMRPNPALMNTFLDDTPPIVRYPNLNQNRVYSQPCYQQPLLMPTYPQLSPYQPSRYMAQQVPVSNYQRAQNHSIYQSLPQNQNTHPTVRYL